MQTCFASPLPNSWYNMSWHTQSLKACQSQTKNLMGCSKHLSFQRQNMSKWPVKDPPMKGSGPSTVPAAMAWHYPTLPPPPPHWLICVGREPLGPAPQSPWLPLAALGISSGHPGLCCRGKVLYLQLSGKAPHPQSHPLNLLGCPLPYRSTPHMGLLCPYPVHQLKCTGHVTTQPVPAADHHYACL